MKSQVYLAKQRNKIVLIDNATNLKWANEYFDCPEEADDFCEQNKLELIDLFTNCELLPPNIKKILIDFGKCDTYESCRMLIQILETVGYTADFYLDAKPYYLTKLL